MFELSKSLGGMSKEIENYRRMLKNKNNIFVELINAHNFLK